MSQQRDGDMFELADDPQQNAVIKVIGVGGGGGNAVQHMVVNNIEGVEFICANTDSQALRKVEARSVIQLGGAVTKGLGAGANPEVGRQAAIEDRERIAEAISGADMIFITAGMGGGTGTGGAPVVAEVAKELGILTVAVVTKPFPFEGKKRSSIAEQGLTQLAESVDSLITIPNEKLLSVLGKNSSLLDAFSAANDVLLGAVQGIADLIMRPGMINVDFADVRTVMSEMGKAMMGSGAASGPDRAEEAAESAGARLADRLPRGLRRCASLQRQRARHGAGFRRIRALLARQAVGHPGRAVLSRAAATILFGSNIKNSS